MKIRQGVTADFKKKCKAIIDGIQEALPIAGEVTRDEIVRTTLAGIGKDDEPFAPYSKAYQTLIDAVGGKPGGVVNLRGVFLKRDYKGGKPKFKNEKRESAYQRRLGYGRRAFVQVSFGEKSFLIQTPPTRPQKGLIDPQSEMSADLIKVTVQKTGFRLDYTPRQKDYMLYHNDTRVWFSVEKTAVRAALASVLATVFKALIRNFNGK